MTDLADPLDHFLAARAAIVAELDALEAMARAGALPRHLVAYVHTIPGDLRWTLAKAEARAAAKGAAV